MRKICIVFGVAEAAMFLPNDELAKLVNIGQSADELTRVLSIVGARKPDKLKPGFYFRYEPSNSKIGPQLLRTLYQVRDQNGSFTFRASRRLVQSGSGARNFRKHRLTGTILKIADSIYFFETKIPESDGLSFAVFNQTASGRGHVRAGLVFQEKTAMQAALEYVGETANLKQLLRMCGYYMPNDPAIDQGIRTIILPRAGEEAVILKLHSDTSH